MKNLFFLISFILFNSIIFSQDLKGYYDAKYFVTVETLLNTPLLYNWRNDKYDYSKYDKNLNPSSDKLNHGYRLSFGFLLQRNIALCIESGIDFSNIYAENNILINNVNYDLQISKLNVQTYSIMPKIEFATKNSLLPLGFSHQIGFGYSNSKLIDKDYTYKTENTNIWNTNPIISDTYIKNHFYDYENAKPIKCYTILYALSMRTGITKNILLNYGFRYTLNIENIIYSSDKSNEFVFKQSEIRDLVNNQKFLNFINFNIGLTYAF